jgi:GT2 family glycosyltransferase
LLSVAMRLCCPAVKLQSPPLQRVGVVAIGRNEGERLKRCLRSIPSGVAGVVYVDSGSTDGSADFARSAGAEVVDLDMSIPFTAARSRNAGVARLKALHPQLELVQLVDGDCAIASGWLETAIAMLDERSDVVAVAGRRRELHPEASAYNRLCDIEWGQTPPGDCLELGGDVLVRLRAFDAVGGYDPSLIAGEDPDFGVRLRHNGGVLVRLAADMTFHDANMHRLEQWWTRAKRCGHAYAQVSQKHAGSKERFWSGQQQRSLAWGLAVPLAVPLLALPTLGASALLLAAYPARVLRLSRRFEREGMSKDDARLWAASCVASSVPEAVGILKYHVDRARGRQAKLIEYKG